MVTVTFLLSFAMAFASLRLVESIRVTQQPLLVMQASNAPTQFDDFFTSDWRGAQPPIPARFDMRFAASNARSDTVPDSLTQHALDRAAHVTGAEPTPAPDAPE